MVDFIPVILVACIFFVAGFFVGCGTGETSKDKRWKQDAIDHDFAQYNIKTGEWEWKEK